jgi:Flp pilus assembly protein CpaB
MKPETVHIKKNVAPLLAIAFIVAAISTGVFYGLFASRLRAAATDAPAQPVVVAARDLAAGIVLKSEDLKISEMRGKTPLKGMFDSPQKLVGATLVEAVHENDAVVERDVAMRDSSPRGGGGIVPSGMRAVSIHVFESSGVLGLIHRGSKVDIQAVLEANGTVSLSPILQNIEVLSVNSQTEQNQNPRGNAPVVTVLTAPADSDILALADSGTRLRVALRNPADDAMQSHKPLNVPMLFRSPDALRSPAPRAGKTGSTRDNGGNRGQ